MIVPCCNSPSRIPLLASRLVLGQDQHQQPSSSPGKSVDLRAAGASRIKGRNQRQQQQQPPCAQPSREEEEHLLLSPRPFRPARLPSAPERESSSTPETTATTTDLDSQQNSDSSRQSSISPSNQTEEEDDDAGGQPPAAPAAPTTPATATTPPPQPHPGRIRLHRSSSFNLTRRTSLPRPVRTRPSNDAPPSPTTVSSANMLALMTAAAAPSLCFHPSINTAAAAASAALASPISPFKQRTPSPTSPFDSFFFADIPHPPPSHSQTPSSPSSHTAASSYIPDIIDRTQSQSPSFPSRIPVSIPSTKQPDSVSFSSDNDNDNEDTEDQSSPIPPLQVSRIPLPSKPHHAPTRRASSTTLSASLAVGLRRSRVPRGGVEQGGREREREYRPPPSYGSGSGGVECDPYGYAPSPSPSRVPVPKVGGGGGGVRRRRGEVVMTAYQCPTHHSTPPLRIEEDLYAVSKTAGQA
ncbi:hypothetical protein HK104_000191 [Borealophlyctis nickersoniae]|nr:hypothetical protein HK104_000191 [Borealophlyctis nickersoniae]